MRKYTVRFSKGAVKALKKLDKRTVMLLYTWIETNLNCCEDPRRIGKALSGNLKGAWRYRVGDYRIIAEIMADKIVILVVGVGHKKEIYK